MGKAVGIGKVFSCFMNSRASSSCFEIEGTFEPKQPLMPNQPNSHLLRFNDVISHTNQQTNPKVVELRVSMHCNGCARRVEKNIGKIEGVDSFKVDFERKTVVVTGDVSSFEVIQCVSKVRSVEILEHQE
ncbi:protein SODIUM POTASSIUM ROOT DEFECTIVE 1-like isoform X1 [Cucurbita maxima]|uniref:Protein SODIUM POTASSIUM ROOT DEFECTIVE 1-like isoform X1 n=1 Tax=Cucurbita maxima TaxID=3661 RepID=A0A6J1KFP0_CUCMA|nr:protein SODIUM POTASSIUM ROOT DEFECTIVE 1-like isoform X1 [Cucurbita maxima]